MDQWIAGVGGEVRPGRPDDLVPVGDHGRAAEVVADLRHDQPEPGLARGPDELADMPGRAGAGVDRGGEAAAQAFERGELRGKIDHVLVEAALERHPDPSEDLRRLPEDQRLAEGLGQVGMRVDEAGHQQVRRHVDAAGRRMTGAERARRVDLAEATVPEQDGHSGTRPIIEQQAAGRDDHVLGRREGVSQIGHQACSSISPAAGALNWKRALTTAAVIVPMARPLPRIICDHCGNWL